MQNALEALGFHRNQTSENTGLQGDALHLFGAEGPLSDDRFGLTFQPDDGLIDGIEPGTARGVHHR